MVQSIHPCNWESSAETVVKVSLKTGLGLMLGLFKRETRRLEEYLLKEKVYGK